MTTHVLLCVAVMAAVTAALRFAPFLIFGDKRKTPALIDKLGRTLPYAIMAMLVVYCLKDVSFFAPADFVPELISLAVVAALYLWRRSTLISIVAGTLCHMLLVQLVF